MCADKRSDQLWEMVKLRFAEAFRKRDETIYWKDFHSASSLSNLDQYSSAGFRDGQEWITRVQEALVYDAYPSLKLISLPAASQINNSALSEAIVKRRSCREPMRADRELSLTDLSDLLYYGYGENPNGFKNIPSGGALYPLDLYLYSFNVELLDAGLYYYSHRDHGLKQLHKKIAREEIDPFFSNKKTYEIVKSSSAHLFITSSFLKNSWKYLERGYRFALMEAGHLAQNINLVAAAKELACLNIGGFCDDQINQFLDLTGLVEATLYIIAIGHR